MKFEMRIYSPRWGHDDTYVLEFTADQFTFRQNAGPWQPAIARYEEGRDPVWENQQAIFKMLKNDLIYPPHILPDALEHLWLRWKDEGMKDEEVQSEAAALADYINTSTRAMPTTDFWSAYF